MKSKTKTGRATVARMQKQIDAYARDIEALLALIKSAASKVKE